MAMNELSIEQKAQRYDKAIKYAYYLINERCKEGTDGSFHRADLQKMFPELAESEDEKIRKAIIEGLREMKSSFHTISSINIDDAIAWLEKQGKTSPVLYNSLNIGKVEPQPTKDRYMEGYLNGVNDASKTLKSDAWSEEDESWFKEMELMCLNFSNNTDYREKFSTWLKSLKDRVFPLPKQEWSEEDEYRKRQICRILRNSGCSQNLQDKIKEWLENRFKSLKPQNRWNDISVPPKFPCDILFKYPNGNKFIFRYLENGRKNSAETPMFSSLEEGEWIYLDDIEPQSHWKPSDEQLRELHCVISGCSFETPILVELEEQLKKL